MAINETAVQLKYGMEKDASTTKAYPYGTVGITPDGRKFRYALAGEAITAGLNIMQKAGIANHDMDLALVAASAVGDTTVQVTLGATAATLNQYADGYLYVNDGAGQGPIHRIKSNPAADSGANLILTLEEDDGIRTALTTATSLLGLMENPYKDVEIFDANDIDGASLGVAPADVDDDENFWVQTDGYANCLMDNTTFVLGSAVEASTATDGAMTLHDVSANTDRKALGTVSLIVAVSGDYGIVKLAIG